MASDYEIKRDRYEAVRAQLKNERSTFESHWRDLADFILPRRPRFVLTDVNRGERKNQRIIDSTATLAARTMRAGMMSGVTSPARDWFRLTLADPNLADVGPVKNWLYTVTRRMSTVFLKSNLYNVLPITYGDLGVFATAAMGIEEDFENVIRFYSFPLGSYWIANDDKGKVSVFMRDFRMTVRQLVQKFGMKPGSADINWDVFSEQIKNMYDSGQKETWIDVTHVIMPNPDWDPKKLHSKYKKFISCYYERGNVSGSDYGYMQVNEHDKYLSESGFDLFPILAPRWEVTGEDTYGTECPGMTALGDIKQLQVMEKRGAQAIEKMVNPPMVAPTSMRNSKTSIVPGDVSYVDIREGMQGFRPAHEVNLRLSELENKTMQIRQRISRSFFEDLFLMLANSDRREITAREIEERHEEKLLALGPVLEQLNQDLLDPLIDVTFDIMNRQGLIPPAPEEVQGAPLKVEYISVMAQAQKAIGIGSVERFAGFVNNVASVSPQALDKVDLDEIIDIYGDFTSIPPSIIRDDRVVAQIRSDRAKAQQAQMMSQMIQQGAGAAKDLSQAKTDEPNALTQLIGQAQAGSLV